MHCSLSNHCVTGAAGLALPLQPRRRQRPCCKLLRMMGMSAIDNFIAESKEWQPNDTVTDTTVYIVKAIEDNSSFLAKYADDITRKVCEVEKEHGEEKLIKVLLYNKTNKQSKKIANARKVFREKITTQWDLRRNSVLKPIESILNPEIINRKKLSDFNLEIWIKDQIEGEEAPFQMRLD